MNLNRSDRNALIAFAVLFVVVCMLLARGLAS